MKLVALIPFLILSFECLSSVTAHVTDFVRFEHSGSYPLLTFINSTSKVYRVGLQAENEASLFSISKDSTFTLDSSSLVSHGSFVPFSLAGELFLSSFSVSQQNLDSSLGSLAITQSPSASISLSSSSFVDLPLSSNLGTFVSSGFTDTQAVENCVFSNVTLHDASETGTLTIVDKCRLENSVIENSQDTFYGLIVSGMSHRTISLFSSKNSTFTNCVRHNPLQFSTIQKLLDNGNCASYPSDGSTTTGQTFSCRSILERTYWNSGDYTFVDCTFSLCTTNLSGGAIYQTKSSYNSAMLNLTNCTFKNCHADQHGGAIFSEYTKNNIIHDTVFTNNTLPQGPFPEDEDVDHDSGAVLCNYTTTTLSVKRCTLEGNKAGGRGGGLYLGNIQSSQTGHLIESCTFIENEAKFSLKDSTEKVLNVAAGIGGGFYALPLQPVTFGECTFIKNNAGWHGAGLVYAYSRTPAYNSVFNWFVFHGNTAYAGLDIYIRAPTMKYTIVDQWTFTDAFTAPPQTDRYQYNTTANERNIVTNDAFLVVGPEVFVNYVAQNKQNTTSCREFDNNTNCQTIAAAIADGRKVSGDNSVWTINTIRVSLEPDNEYEEPTSVNIGDNIIHIAPRFVSKDTSSPLLNIKTSLSSAVYSINDGVANFTKFEIKVTTALTNPLVEITEQGKGHLWFYDMTVSSESTLEHTSSLLSIRKGELYVSNTEIKTFTLNDKPLISVVTSSTYQFPVRFVSTTISTIKRNSDGGSVFDITFDKSSTAYTITGLKCTSCTSTGTTGGAVSATINDGKTLTLSGCDFTDCSCAKSKVTIDTNEVDVMKGGAVYVNIQDSTSLIQLLSSKFSLKDSDVTGQYVYVDCKDGETVGWKDYWSGTLNAALTETERPYYWLDSKTGNTDDSRKHYSRSLYYFVFTPVEGGKQQMIVDVDNGADIRTCGWASDLIPCKTIYSAFDKRQTITDISLTERTTPYPTGLDQFSVGSDLNIAGPESALTGLKATIAIDNWSKSVPIFQIKNGTTTFSYVAIELTTSITTQFIQVTSTSIDSKTYNGELKLNYVTITCSTDGSTSSYFLRTLYGPITLDNVDVKDFTLSGNLSFVGVSTSSHKSTLTIQDSKFQNVVCQKGKGSVITLTTSSYADITLKTVTFKDCYSSTAYGAIYDYLALTDDSASIVEKGTTFSFTATTFERDAKATTEGNPYLVQLHALFEEPARYIFSETAQLMWKALLGNPASYATIQDSETLFMAKATGSPKIGDADTLVPEPSEPFSLVHVCFTPKAAEQTTLHVAGKVNDDLYYYDIGLPEYSPFTGCGWEDIPCMTIGQTIEQLSDTETTISLNSLHSHQAENAAVVFETPSGKDARTINIQSSSEAVVVKPVKLDSPISGLSSLITIDTDKVNFKRIQFFFATDPEFHIVTLNAKGTLTLTNVIFNASTPHTKSLVFLQSQNLELESTQFATTPSYADGEHGGYVSVECADGSVFTPAGDGAQFTRRNDLQEITAYFKPEDALSDTICQHYWLTESAAHDTPTYVAQSATLLHWIYSPADAKAQVMHVHSASGAPADPVKTCGWSDLPCKDLADALAKRGDIETIQFDADYELTKTISHTAGKPLTLSALLKTTGLTIATKTPTNHETAVIKNTQPLKLTTLSIYLSPDGLTSPLESVFESSGSFTLQDVIFTTADSIRTTTLPCSIIKLSGGSLTITQSTIENFNLKKPLIQVTAASDNLPINIAHTVLQQIEMKDNTDLPAVLCCPADKVDTVLPVTVVLTNDTFNGCKSAGSTQGGAIYFLAGDSTHFTLESSKLSNCECNGKGGFLYLTVSDSDSENKIDFTVRMVECSNNKASNFGGDGLFVHCTNLENSLATSAFTVYLNSNPDAGEIRLSSYYSFWGEAYNPYPGTGAAGATSGTYDPNDNTVVDLLAFFNYYADTTIYVSSTAEYNTGAVQYAEKDCGSKEKPCKTISDGAKHVLPGEDSHIYLMDDGCIFATDTALNGLTLSAQPSTDGSIPTDKHALSVQEGTLPKVTISGSVTLYRLALDIKAASSTDGPLFTVQPTATLTVKESSIAGTNVAYTVISLTQSNLKMNTVTMTGFSFTGANAFISANGPSGSETSATYTVLLSGCTFTDATAASATKPFLLTQNGATVKCTGTTFDYSTSKTIHTLFTFSGDSLIDGCTIKKKEQAAELTLGSDLITVTAGVLTLSSKTTISDLSLATYSLVSSETEVIVSGCTFKNLDHSTSTKSLFTKTFTITGCTFDSIKQGTGALLTPDSGAVSITGSKFYFTTGNMQNLMTIYGGSEIRECDFEPAEGTESIGITNTLITIASEASNTNAVTFETCNFNQISSTPASGVISSVVKVILDNVNLKFTETATLQSFLVLTGEANLEASICTVEPYQQTKRSTNAVVPTLTNTLISSTGSIILNKVTIKGLTVEDGKYVLSASTALIIADDCEFTSLSATATTNPVLFPKTGSTPTSLTITDTQFTFSNLYLLEIPVATTVTKCTFEPSDADTVVLSKAAITVSASTSFVSCNFNNIQSGESIISSTDKDITLRDTNLTTSYKIPTFVSTASGVVEMTSCHITASTKIEAPLIVAKTATLSGCTFNNLDHSTSTKSLFTKTFTITGCTFDSISQKTTSVEALLTPDSGAVSITGSKFYFTGENMQNLMKIYGGSEIRECDFEPAEGTESIGITNTLITIAAEDGNTNAVTFETCNFNKISSTPASGVISSVVKVILDDVHLKFAADAELYAFATTTGQDMEFKDCTFIPFTAGTKASLKSALITVGSTASLILTNTTISDLTLAESKSCILTTPETATTEADYAKSVSIDGCHFKTVVQPEDSTNAVPIFNTPCLESYRILNCEFDALKQVAKDSYLLSAPTATTFTVTNTKFYLPETVTSSILDVTKIVTFSSCHFGKSATVGAAHPTTELTAPLINVNGRTDLTLLDCTFDSIRAINPNKPAVVDLGETVTLIARNCAFTNVSSQIKIGQVFNAHTSAVFDNCSFTETVINEEGTEVCYWNASIVQLSGGDCSLTNTLFHNISQGALGISGGAQVTIDGWDFEENHPKLEGYQKMQRNINCTERSVLVIKDDNGNIDSTTSLYLISDKCEVSYDLQKDGKAVNPPLSTFFIPTLSEANAKLNSDSELALGFKGTNIIPCSLDFEIFLEGDDEKPAFSAPLVSNDDIRTARRNQEQEAAPAAGSDEWPEFKTTVDLTNTPEVYGMTATGVRLSYGDTEDMKTQKATFDPPLVFPTARQAQGGSETEPEDDDKWAWWMWLIIGGGSFLFLLIVILCIVCCCCQDDEEKEEDEDEDMEDVKTVSAETLMALNTKDLLPNTAFKDFDANKVVTVEAMNTTAPYDKTVISAKKSIYYQIHNPSHRQDHNPFMWSATIAYHICNGVEHILDTIYNDQPTSSNEVGVDVMKTILNTLSPHCIFAGDRDAILLGSVPNNYQVPVSANSKEGKTDFSLECQRYRSPEMTQHPNDDSRAMKESNAVFAIGFIMYEVFTGWLVFDGYPHSRVVEMVASGARPDLVLVRSVDSNFASIIEAATNMDAEQRPTIAQLLERIDMYLPNDLRKGAQQHFARSLLDDDDDDL